MIDVNCPECGRVLIGSRQILSVTASADGVEMAYVCGCGRVGAELVRPARRRPSPAHAGAATTVIGR
jgi:hypothetical protein